MTKKLMMIAQQAFYHKISDAFVQMQERMRQTIRATEGAYDQVIIDCAPGLSQLVWGALRAADLVFMPYIPDRTAEDNVGWLAERLRVIGHPKFFTIANRVRVKTTGPRGSFRQLATSTVRWAFRSQLPRLWQTRSITAIRLVRWHPSLAQQLSM
jgi:cellulose biosynthesis protein BcsQ